MKRRVEVRTACRLHFGLTSLGHDLERPQFGGVGVMVDVPGVQLEITPADAFGASGPMSERVASFAASVADHLQISSLPEVNIRVVSAPREHVGLGVGSQLGLAIAAGLAEVLGCSERDALRLSQLSGRGRRSAIGTHGFLLGGFLVDGGHLAHERLGRLVYRGDVPSQWRFLLMNPSNQAGCAGAAEDQAIASLPPVPLKVTRELEEITHFALIPALQQADFVGFSEGVYRYGCLAGKCFATIQGGTFSSPVTADLIAWLRSLGVVGVGQSSWGPTVFAVLPDAVAAAQLLDEVRGHARYRCYDCAIAPAANRGAVVDVIEQFAPATCPETIAARSS